MYLISDKKFLALLTCKSHFDQLYVVFFPASLPASPLCGFTWALTAFLRRLSEILFHRMTLELNAHNDSCDVLTVLGDVGGGRHEVTTDSSHVVRLLDLLGADVSYRFARGGHLLSCQTLWALPRNNSFITMALDVPEMFIDTTPFCLNSYVLWIETAKFIFLVLKRLLFCINESCNQPSPHPHGRCVVCLTGCSSVEQNGCSLCAWVKKASERVSK